MKVITPDEFMSMRSGNVDYVLEHMNSHMEATGNCNMYINITNHPISDSELKIIKHKLLDAGWILKSLELKPPCKKKTQIDRLSNSNDEPPLESYIHISLDLPIKTRK